jgi:hypothetical protein
MIRPGYWTDTDLQTRLTAEVREFYVGLWMEADDAGYVAWDVDRIGADLYPFRALAWRRKRIPEWIQELASHVRVLDCGKHAVIPNLTKYQSCPKPSYQNQRSHDSCLRLAATSGTTGDHMAPGGEREPVGPHGTTGDHMAPAQEGKRVKKGRELKGNSAQARENDGETGGLRDRLGSFEDVMAAGKP